MQDSSSIFSFACPHCGTVNPIPAAQAVGVVSCASCARPFRAEVPAGQLLPGVPAAPTPAAPQTQAGAASPAQEAPEALRIHPAAWRMRLAATVCDAVLVAGGLGFVGWSLSMRGEGAWADFFLIGGALLWLVGSFNLAVPWIKARGEMLVVSDVSTCWSKGWFKRRSVEIRHDAVRAVEVEQTLVERLLGIGTLTLASDGNDADEIVMKGVPGVKKVAEAIRGRMGNGKEKAS